MSFRDPGYLWLLTLLVIPLILYLLPLPRRQIISSALFLWERFLESERFGNTTERFRRALGLALIFAILISLILGAADPMVGRQALSAKSLVVLLDTSASMNAVVDRQSNLERAKDAAIRLVRGFDAKTATAVAEAADDLHLLHPLEPSGPLAIRRILEIQPFEGPGEMRTALLQAHRIWGENSATEIYVFTDQPVPENPWGKRLHSWIAPAPGDNVGVINLAAERHGQDIAVRATIGNYGKKAVKVGGAVLVNTFPRDTFQGLVIEPGATAVKSFTLTEGGEAAIQIKLFPPDGEDALATDDTARAVVPSLEQLRVRVSWPQGKQNPYVKAALSVLRDQGICDVFSSEAENEKAPVTLYVNHSPAQWPEGGAVLLYPLKSDLVEILGLDTKTMTITHQADHPLLAYLDLRGLVVRNSVSSKVPDWAQPIAWADDQPLIWAGQKDKTKVLFIGIALNRTDSRLTLMASFPVLMRNALSWMLPGASILRPGERLEGWTSRKTGFIENPAGGKLQAFSLLSAPESDLRRASSAPPPAIPGRFSLAFYFVIFALALLVADWVLFHRRITE